MKNFKLMVAIVFLGTVISSPLMAQQPSSVSVNPGGGACTQANGPGCGIYFGQRNSIGWSLMTPDERAAHRQRMLSAKTYEECKTIQADQHRKMETRAREKGVTLQSPPQNVCDRMKARGVIK